MPYTARMTTLSPSLAGSEPDISERVAAIGRMLASAGAAYLSTLRSPVRTSSDLVRAANVNKDVANRFMMALGKQDPLAVVYYMPGVEALRRLSRAARDPSADPAAVRAFDDAIAAFERFLQDELGGRHALDAIASAWLPEARERFESASRQMIFRGTANLRGVECQSMIDAVIIHPGGDPDRFDSVSISGVIGVRRLRPSVPLRIATFASLGATAGRPWFTSDGRPASDEAPMEVLPRFGRGEPPPMRIARYGSCIAYEIVGEALGAATAADAVFGQYTPGSFRRWARKPGDAISLLHILEVPAQRLVMDVLLHPEVWPGREPELSFFDTTIRGYALPDDPSRAADRMELVDTVRRIGTGVECCRIAEMPRYVDLLRWACEQRGWNPSAFRVYRLDGRYPPCGVQYVVSFRQDERPASEAASGTDAAGS